MRVASTTLLVCALRATAMADSNTVWDATYERESSGGTEFCPAASVPFSIANGTFSIVWNVKYGDKLIPVGRINGSVAASGEVVPSVKLADPPPPMIVEMMRDAGSGDHLGTIARNMKLTVRSSSTRRELRLSSNMCYASWTASGGIPERAPAPPPSPPANDPPPQPAASKKASTKAKATVKPAVNKAAAAKPAKSPPAAKAAKAAKATTPPKSAPSRSGSSTASSRVVKEEPRKRGASNGASCGYDTDCESNNCEYRKCTSKDRTSKRLGNGFACSYSSDCKSNNCEYGKCASADRTNLELGTGADCNYSSDCASGSCTYNKCTD